MLAQAPGRSLLAQPWAGHVAGLNFQTGIIRESRRAWVAGPGQLAILAPACFLHFLPTNGPLFGQVRVNRGHRGVEPVVVVVVASAQESAAVAGADESGAVERSLETVEKNAVDVVLRSDGDG